MLWARHLSPKSSEQCVISEKVPNLLRFMEGKRSDASSQSTNGSLIREVTGSNPIGANAPIQDPMDQCWIRIRRSRQDIG